jgi:hypothetical protein
LISSDFLLSQATDAPGAAEHEHHLRRLRERLTDRMVGPTDHGWDAARRAWNLAADQHPALVAFPETADEIVDIVAFAREHGLRVTPQGTGHGAGPLRSLADTVLLKFARMNTVHIDPDRRRARVGAGATWGQVQHAAAAHGLAGLAGSSLNVGVAGYTLGGGLGWLGRRHGLACNSVLAVDVVTSDGRTLRVDGDDEPDLFWALRGGGGSFAVVTALEIELYPAPELYAGVLYWPHEQATEILQAWRTWTAGLPEAVTSVGRILALPDSRWIPTMLRNRSFVAVEAACLTGEAEGIELLRPMRDLGPTMDTFGMLPPTMLDGLHMDPIEPIPAYFDGWLVGDLPAEAIDALVAAAGSASGSPLMSVELRHLGGALAEVGPDHGALASLEAGFAAVTLNVAGEETHLTAEERTGAVRAALAPWEAERTYPNFAARSLDASAFFEPETAERLRRVKGRYDPTDVICSPHPVPPRV